MDDWSTIRAMKFSTETPPADWPTDVVPISIKGLVLFGLNKRNNRLHFDGEELVTRHQLAKFERWMLGIGAASAAVLSLIEVGRVVAAILH